MDPVFNLLLSLLPLVLIIGLVFVVMKFVLRRSHDGMDTSLKMQVKAVADQAEAIQLCRETLELNKKMLSEMTAIKELLEKR